MAVLRRPHEQARQLARLVLLECGADEPAKIDPLAIVGRRGIVVVYAKLDGATAQILRNGERAIIRVSDQIVQVGRFRFTIAHEVGHFLLGHRIPDAVELSAAQPFSVHQEREANVFAVEFLMPEELVRPYCADAPMLATVRTIAETFRMSLSSSMSRYVELTNWPCAVVYSEHGRVVWAKRSATFPGRIPAQLKIGDGTLACDLHSGAQPDITSARAVPARAWFGSQLPAEMVDSLVEYAVVVPEPGWGGVLSLLAPAP